MALLSPDEMREWVSRYFRDLEYIDHEPWDEATHGHLIQYPVPVQHVKFDVPKPVLERPDPRRISAFITRSPLERQGIKRSPLLRTGI